MKKNRLAFLALSVVFAVSSANAGWFDKLREMGPDCVEKLAISENASGLYLQDPEFLDLASRIQAVTRAEAVLVQDARSTGEAREYTRLLWNAVLAMGYIDRDLLVRGKILTIVNSEDFVRSPDERHINVSRRILAIPGGQPYLVETLKRHLTR